MRQRACRIFLQTSEATQLDVVEAEVPCLWKQTIGVGPSGGAKVTFNRIREVSGPSARVTSVHCQGVQHPQHSATASFLRIHHQISPRRRKQLCRVGMMLDQVLTQKVCSQRQRQMVRKSHRQLRYSHQEPQGVRSALHWRHWMQLICL